MATKKIEEAPDKESIFIPRGSSAEDPNYFVSVNGKNFILPKGQTSVVPRYVADEIRRSWRAQEAFEQRKQALLGNN